MSSYGRILRNMVQQKMKYANKVLTEQGMLNQQFNFFDIFDIYSFLSNLQISSTLFSSFISSFLLGIDLNNIIPDNIVFEVELPDLQQWLNGVLIILKQINLQIALQNLIQSLSTLNIQINLNDLINMLKQPQQFLIPQINLGTLNKAYYNKSYYGQAYVDPAAVANFFKSTMYDVVIKHKNPATARSEAHALAQALNLRDTLAGNLFDRIQAIKAVREQACTFDYCWFDYSYIAPEPSPGSWDGLVTFDSYSGEKITLPYRNLLDFQAGCYFDFSVFDYCLMLDYEVTGNNVYRNDAYNINLLHDAIYRNFRSRINTTPIALANYQTTEARLDPYKSKRVDMYGLSILQLRQLDEVTARIVRQMNPKVDPFTLRQYKVAVENLYSTLFQEHRWGRESQQAMTKNQLKTWWVQKWSLQGLDANILNQLFDNVYQLVVIQGKIRTKERLNFLRRKLYG